jgi:DNA-binding MarR family transcriptional regulator
VADDNELKSFTSLKLDWIDALMVAVSGPEFRVAVCLLQHANADTMRIFPSQQRIATLLGLDASTVKRRIAALVRDGVLVRERSNRRMSNSYSFSRAWIAAALRQRDERINRLLAIRDGASAPPQETPEGASARLLDGASTPPAERASAPPKHLKGTPEAEHLEPGCEENGEVYIGSKPADKAPPNGAHGSGRATRTTLPEISPALAATKAFQESRVRPRVDPKVSLDAMFGSGDLT